MRKPAIRRTEAQWKQLINEYKQSNLKVLDFCKLHHITPSSFYAWKSKLNSKPASCLERKSQPSNNPFIDLSHLAGNIDLPKPKNKQTNNNSHWHITLSLGNGLELNLTQQLNSNAGD